MVQYDNNASSRHRGEWSKDNRLIARKEGKDQPLVILDDTKYQAFLQVANINIEAKSKQELYPSTSTSTTTTVVASPPTLEGGGLSSHPQEALIKA